MNIAENIINEAMGDSIERIYPYFVYQQTLQGFNVFHFFEGDIIPNSTATYYGKAWCRHTFDLPYRKSLVPLEGDRVISTCGDVIEIIHLVRV